MRRRRYWLRSPAFVNWIVPATMPRRSVYRAGARHLRVRFFRRRAIPGLFSFRRTFHSPFRYLLQTLTEPLQSLVDGQLTACELLEDVNIWRGRVEILVERGSDGVQAVFHRRVADIEQSLHFLERAVVTYEGDHKCLVVERELGQRRDFEFAVHSDAAFGASRLGKFERLLTIGADSLRNIHLMLPRNQYLHHKTKKCQCVNYIC